MSAATRAQSATERATIAIQKIRTGQTRGRSFDDCFEMNDGAEVFQIILSKAKKNEDLMTLCRALFSAKVMAEAESNAIPS